MRNRKPKTISYRVSQEEWLMIVRESAEMGITPHDWGRFAAQERLKQKHGLSVVEKMLMFEMARIHFLVLHGFRLMAEEKLSPEEWKAKRAEVFNEPEKVAENLLMKIKETEAINGEAAVLFRSSRRTRKTQHSENGHEQLELPG